MKMDQVTIRTRAFQEEIAFYKDIVGLRIVREMHEGPLNIVFLSNGIGETCIEIIEHKEAFDTGNSFLSIGFQTENADQLRSDLQAKGYEVSPMESPAPVVQFFFVKDPAGVNVQFVEGGH